MIALIFIILCLFWSGLAFRYSKMHLSQSARHFAAIDPDDPPDEIPADENNNLPVDRPTGRYIPMTEFDAADLLEPDMELEQTMAVELFNLLRGPEEGLSLEKFLEWEDIHEVLERGILDKESIEIIVREVGVEFNIMNFNQFQEIVDLVNQLSTTLEAGDLVGDDDDDSNDDMDTEEFERLDKDDDSSFGPGNFEIWRERP